MCYGVRVYCLLASVCTCTGVCVVSCNIATVIFGSEAVLKTLTLSLRDWFARYVLEKPCPLNKVHFIVFFFFSFFNGTVSHDNVFMATSDAFS